MKECSTRSAIYSSETLLATLPLFFLFSLFFALHISQLTPRDEVLQYIKSQPGPKLINVNKGNY